MERHCAHLIWNCWIFDGYLCQYWEYFEQFTWQWKISIFDIDRTKEINIFRDYLCIHRIGILLCTHIYALCCTPTNSVSHCSWYLCIALFQRMNVRLGACVVSCSSAVICLTVAVNQLFICVSTSMLTKYLSSVRLTSLCQGKS